MQNLKDSISVAFIVNASIGKGFAEDIGRMFTSVQRKRYHIRIVSRDDAHDGWNRYMNRRDLLNKAEKIISTVREQMADLHGVTCLWVSRGIREEPLFHQQIRAERSNGYCVFPVANKLPDELMFNWLLAFMEHLLYLKQISLSPRLHKSGQSYCLCAPIRNFEGLPPALVLNDVCCHCLQDACSLLQGDHSFRMLTDFLEQNRPKLLQRTRMLLVQNSASIRITDPKFDILFPELNNRNVVLTPLEKVVYFLFLRIPEGLHLSEVGKYQDWMKGMYSKLAITRSRLQINKHIRALCDSSDNSISEKISRIRLKLEALGGRAFADRFSVKGERGGVKRIHIDRASIAVDKAASSIFADGTEKTS